MPSPWGSFASLQRSGFHSLYFTPHPFFSLSPPIRPTFILKENKLFSSLLFFLPCKEPRRGKTGWWRREKPLPFPSPVGPSSEKKDLGGFLPFSPLPSPLLASPPRSTAPQSRSRRCSTRPPSDREGPAGSRTTSGKPRTGPFCELRGRGGMRGAAAPGDREQGRLGFASGRESGGGGGRGRAGQRWGSVVPARSARSLAPAAAPPAPRRRE